MKFSIGVHGGIGVNAKAELKVSRGRTYTKDHRYVLYEPKKPVLTKTFQAGPVPVIVIVRVAAVARLSLNANAEATGSISISYNNPNLIAIKKAHITFDPSNGRVTPDFSFSKNFHTNIVPKITVNAAAHVTGEVRIGPEITVEVNGIPFKFYPNVRFEVKASLNVVNRCLSGLVTAGIRLDVGSGVAVPTILREPGAALGQGCLAGVSMACSIGGAANCMAKALSGGKVDPCAEARKQCHNLAKAAKKAFPAPITLPRIPLNSFPIPSTSKTVTLMRYSSSKCVAAHGASSAPVSASWTSTCGGNVNGAGIKYPSSGRYGNRKDCTWTIRRSRSFTIRFISLDIERHSQCKYDWVKVNGRKYCGTSLPKDFFSTSTTIQFHSDGSVSRTGFKVQVVPTSGDAPDVGKIDDESEKPEFDYVFHETVPEEFKDAVVADEDEKKDETSGTGKK